MKITVSVFVQIATMANTVKTEAFVVILTVTETVLVMIQMVHVHVILVTAVYTARLKKNALT